MDEKEYNEALEKARIFFLEKCGEMSLAHRGSRPLDKVQNND